MEKVSYLGSVNQSHGVHLVSNQRSYAALSQVPGSAIGTVERIVSALPQPKRPGTTAKPAAPKEGQPATTPGVKSALPVLEKKLPQNETNESALKSTTSWANFNQIQKKLSVGTVTTTKYHERAQNFDILNEKTREHSNILPQHNYFGQTPDPTKDPYDRRKVK